MRWVSLKRELSVELGGQLEWGPRAHRLQVPSVTRLERRRSFRPQIARVALRRRAGGFFVEPNQPGRPFFLKKSLDTGQVIGSLVPAVGV